MWKRPKRTTDTMTGAPFVWNDTVRVGGLLVPCRYTPNAATFLHPTRVPLELLQQLNPYVPVDYLRAVTQAARERTERC